MAHIAALGEQLLDAAIYDDAECVRNILAAGEVGVNYYDRDGFSALLCASQDGYTEVVRVLLAVEGINANHASNKGSTALILASQDGYTEVVRVLLAVEGVNANHADNEGSTALILASQYGHAEVVRALLATDGINANQAKNNGVTALMMASQNCHAVIARALLAVDGIDANHVPATNATIALILAPQQDDPEIVRALLAVDGINADHANTNGAALMLAVFKSDLSCVRALAAAKGTNINLPCQAYDNRSALHGACTLQRADVVEALLLAGGCRFLRDDGGNTPLDLAAGNTDVLKVFASGINYWQRKRHGRHSWAMKEAIATLLLVRQRLDAQGAASVPPAVPQGHRALRSRSLAPTHAAVRLPHLPEEIWLAACGFLRSADFMP